jgi:hypothetical protein
VPERDPVTSRAQPSTTSSSTTSDRENAMNWEAIGAVGEIVGAAGVIVTLGFLVYQLRQNTRALRADSFRSVFELGHSRTSKIIENPEVADLYHRGRKSYHGLSPVDQSRFHYLMAQTLHSIQAMLLYHRVNDEQTIFGEMARNQVARAAHDEGSIEWWETRGQAVFDEAFRVWVQSVLDEERGLGGVEQRQDP